MGQVHHRYKLHTSAGDPSCIEAEESSPMERFWCSHRCKQTKADAVKERLNRIWLILLMLQSKVGSKGETGLVISKVMCLCQGLPCITFVISFKQINHLPIAPPPAMLCATAQSWHCSPTGVHLVCTMAAFLVKFQSQFSVLDVLFLSLLTDL